MSPAGWCAILPATGHASWQFGKAQLELDPRRAATGAEKPAGVLVSSRALTLLWLHFPTPRKRRFPRQDVRHHPTSLLQTGHRRAGAGAVGAAFSQGGITLTPLVCVCVCVVAFCRFYFEMYKLKQK